MFNYCNTLWTDITKILGEKAQEVYNLALIILFIISKGTGKQSPTGISHNSCFNLPPLISRVAQIKDRPSPLPDAASHCRALRKEQPAQRLLSVVATSTRQHPEYCQATQGGLGQKGLPPVPGQWGNGQHRAQRGGKNNRRLKVNILKMLLHASVHNTVLYSNNI